MPLYPLAVLPFTTLWGDMCAMVFSVVYKPPKGSSMRTRLLEVFGHYFWQVLEYRHSLIICSSTFQTFERLTICTSGWASPWVSPFFSFDQLRMYINASFSGWHGRLRGSICGTGVMLGLISDKVEMVRLLPRVVCPTNLESLFATLVQGHPWLLLSFGVNWCVLWILIVGNFSAGKWRFDMV